MALDARPTSRTTRRVRLPHPHRRPPHTTPERTGRAYLRHPQPTPGDATTPPENVHITDTPAATGGRSYLVDRGLEEDGYTALKALVADYVEQSEQRDEPAILVPDPQ